MRKRRPVLLFTYVSAQKYKQGEQLPYDWLVYITESEQTLGFPWFVQCQCGKAKFNPGLQAGNKTSCQNRDETSISKWESAPLLFEEDCYKNIPVQCISVPGKHGIIFKKSHHMKLRTLFYKNLSRQLSNAISMYSQDKFYEWHICFQNLLIL